MWQTLNTHSLLIYMIFNHLNQTKIWTTGGIYGNTQASVPVQCKNKPECQDRTPCCHSASAGVFFMLFSSTEFVINNYPVLPICTLEMFFFLAVFFFYWNNTAAKLNSGWMSGNREVLWDWSSPVMPHLVNNSAAVHFPVINWMNHFVVDDTERMQ